MANLPISGLVASAANLAGTDVVPVVQTTGVGPVKMTGLQLAGGLLGSTALTGATVTTSQPVLDLSQTWNAGAVTFTGLRFNAAGTSDANSAAGSLLLDLQVGGTSAFSVRKDNTVIFNTGNSYQVWPAPAGYGWRGLLFGQNASGAAKFAVSDSYAWVASGVSIGFGSNASAGGAFPDTMLTRGGASATLQLGAADAAAPAAQTLQVQSVVAGTTNTAGANFTINGSRSTGNAAGGSIIFQVAPAGSSGTAQNSFISPLQVLGTGGITGVDGATANTLALRNGASAQTFNVYNTFTDASIYERGFIRWNANVFQIGAEAAGSGTNRNVSIVTGSGTWTFAASGGATFPAASLVFSGRYAISGSTGVVALLSSNLASGAALELQEQTAPSAPASNRVRIYAEDDGAGKTRLMALFATGAAVQIAIEP